MLTRPEEREARDLAEGVLRARGGDSRGFYDRKRLAMILGPILRAPHAVVIEIGSAGGTTTLCLHRAKGVNIAIGLDSDRDALREGVRSGNPSAFVLADGEKGLPFRTSSVDCVLASEVYEHFYRGEDFFMEAHRVLKPNGLLVLTTPNTQSLALTVLRRLPREWSQKILTRRYDVQRFLHPEFFGVLISTGGHGHRREGASLREMERLAVRFGFRQLRGVTWGLPFATESLWDNLPRPLSRFVLDRFHTLPVGLRHIMVVWSRTPEPTP